MASSVTLTAFALTVTSRPLTIAERRICSVCTVGGRNTVVGLDELLVVTPSHKRLRWRIAAVMSHLRVDLGSGWIADPHPANQDFGLRAASLVIRIGQPLGYLIRL